MCLHERRFPWDGPTYPRSDELSRPSLPSCSKGTRRYKLDAEAKDLFTRALNHSLDAGFVPKNDMPDGYWLAALIHLEAINCADWLDHINAQRSSVGHDAVTKEPQQLSDQMSELCKTLQSDISQVVALRKTPSVLVRSADYEEDLLMLDRLLREAMVIASDMRELLDLQHRAKNTQVAELAINESRSAIAGTFISETLHHGGMVLTIRSHSACIRVHPHQPGIVRIRDERAGNQRNRSQHLGIFGHSFCIADDVRTGVDGLACVTQLGCHTRREMASLASHPSYMLAGWQSVLADVRC
jgi:hypothetical protein